MPTSFAHLGTPIFYVGMSALVGATAAEGGVALWAATSRVHWFWRAIAVWAAAMALLPIRAYEPAFVFAISSPSVIAIVLAYRWLLGRLSASRTQQEVPPRGLRFGLRDIFLILLLAGIWLASLIQIIELLDDPPVWALVKVAAAIASLQSLSCFLVWGPRRWVALILLLIALPIAVTTLSKAWWLDMGGEILAVGEGSVEWVNYLAAAILLVVVTVTGVWLATMDIKCDSVAKRWLLLTARAGVEVLAVAPLFLLYWKMLWLEPFPPDVSDPGNNYSRIVAIARRFDRSITAELRVASFAELLPLLDAANHVQFNRTEGYGGQMDDNSWLRQICRSLDAEAESAAASGNFDGSADLALANVRLGTMLCRGGIVVDYLSGVAITAVGHQQLVKVRDQLSLEKQRQVIASLSRCTKECEPIASILARDRAYEENYWSWQTRLERIVTDLCLDDSIEDACRYARLRAEADSALLQTDCAIRIFKQQHGRLPQTLGELVPGIVARIAPDPHSEQLPIYRPVADTFVLYSVGEDKIDDGGRFTNWATYRHASGYDLDLETISRP